MAGCHKSRSKYIVTGGFVMAFALFLLFEVYYISLDRPYSGLNWFDVVLITINILILVSSIKAANARDYYQNTEEGRKEWQESERKKNMTYFEKFREEQEALLKKKEEEKKWMEKCNK